MNKIVLIANKYRNNNKKNRPYHIIISCIKLFSLIILLGILFLNYYNNEILNNNRVNRLYEVNVGKISHDKSSSVFEECPYILKYFEKNSDYNINNELINTSYEIELKNIKYSELFIEEMNTYKFGVIISNNNIKSQSSIKVFGVYNAMLIGL